MTSKIIQFPAGKQADEFTARKLRWIEAVTLDTLISAEAARLAVLVAVKFLSRRSGVAFPSQKTIGAMLGITERQVRRHIGALVEAGHIAQKSRGRNRSNEYRITFATGHRMSAGTKRDRTSGVRSGPDIPRPPNPMREPIDGRPTAGDPIDRCSTLDVVEGSRPKRALHQQRVCRVGSRFEIPDHGWCTVEAIYPLERQARVRFDGTGETRTIGAKADVVFEDAGEMNDEIPF